MNLSANLAKRKKFSGVISNLFCQTNDIGIHDEEDEGEERYALSRVNHFTRTSMSLGFSPGRGIYVRKEGYS